MASKIILITPLQLIMANKKIYFMSNYMLLEIIISNTCY